MCPSRIPKQDFDPAEVTIVFDGISVSGHVIVERLAELGITSRLAAKELNELLDRMPSLRAWLSASPVRRQRFLAEPFATLSAFSSHEEPSGQKASPSLSAIGWGSLEESAMAREAGKSVEDLLRRSPNGLSHLLRQPDQVVDVALALRPPDERDVIRALLVELADGAGQEPV